MTAIRKETLVEPIKLFAIISWVLLPTVMFGRYSLLKLKRDQNTWLTAFRESHFRAGHAHAGVLLILSLVYYLFLGQTSFPAIAKIIASLLFLLGILAQSGGFFITMLSDKPGAASPGHLVSGAGAILLAISSLLVAFGLITV